MSSDWRQQEEALLQMPRQKRAGNARETSEVAGDGAGGEDLDSGAASNWYRKFVTST